MLDVAGSNSVGSMSVCWRLPALFRLLWAQMYKRAGHVRDLSTQTVLGEALCLRVLFGAPFACNSNCTINIV